MMKAPPPIGLFAVLCVAACSASTRVGAGDGNESGGSAGAGSGNGLAAAGEVNISIPNGGSPAIQTGGDGAPDAGDVMNGVCANQGFDLQRKPAEILIVLDRSASMKDPPSGSTGTSKWNVVVPGVNQVVTSTDSSVSWGLKVFPEGAGSECSVGSVTSAVPVKIAPVNAMAVTAGITATTPAGNGTPTGDAIKAAVAYLKTVPDQNPKFILLATDGEPSCAGTTHDATAARLLAVQAITDAATAGFKTFVVGVATTKTTATQALNDMAVAGQMPRMDPNPLAPKYYLASTKDALVAALETITGQASSCVFTLKNTPPDPTNIAVHVNGVRAPHDVTRVDGWEYLGTNYSQLQVYGSWCDQIKGAAANQVNIVLGCPGQPPPK